MDNNEFERALDREVDSNIEEAEIKKRAYNFEEEMKNAENPCCDECQGQSIYKLKG